MLIYTLITLNVPVNLPKIEVQLMLLKMKTSCDIRVTSRDRTWEHNKKVGGSSRSYHLIPNNALDVIPVCDKSIVDIGRQATKFFNGVIVYNDHIHLDLRPELYYKNHFKF